MRWWVLGLLIAMAGSAVAADYDDSWLRGSQVIGAAPTPPPRLYRIWAGVYGGAQVGEDFNGVDFRQLPYQPIQSAISQDGILQILAAPTAALPALPQVNTRGPSYGGFIGYNWQLDDVVFGVELNINRSSLHQTAINTANSGYWVNYGGNLFDTKLYTRSQGDISMSDYLTMRGRLGWAFGNFLPYMVAGVAFGQIDSSKKVEVGYTGVCVNPAPPADPTCPIVNGQNQQIGANYPFANVIHGKYQLGFDAAVGMDYMVTRYVFVRGELEYINFQYPNDIRMNTLSTRIAAGLRF
jgi:outer membrane immunogenic protein